MTRGAGSEGAGLTQRQTQIEIPTSGPGFTDITRRIASWLGDIDAAQGLLTLFVRHTSASLTIQENADPAVLEDLMTAFDRFAPRNAGYRHSSEGPDDMPSHIKSMITSTSLTIPVANGEALLGTWQAVYLIEHRDRPRSRTLVLHYQGTCA